MRHTLACSIIITFPVFPIFLSLQRNHWRKETSDIMSLSAKKKKRVKRRHLQTQPQMDHYILPLFSSESNSIRWVNNMNWTDGRKKIQVSLDDTWGHLWVLNTCSHLPSRGRKRERERERSCQWWKRRQGRGKIPKERCELVSFFSLYLSSRKKRRIEKRTRGLQWCQSFSEMKAFWFESALPASGMILTFNKWSKGMRN